MQLDLHAPHDHLLCLRIQTLRHAEHAQVVRHQPHRAWHRHRQRLRRGRVARDAHVFVMVAVVLAPPGRLLALAHLRLVPPAAHVVQPDRTRPVWRV